MQLKLGFKQTINWKKYPKKVSIQGQKQYFNYLFNPSFQRKNKIFVLLFKGMRSEQYIQHTSKARDKRQQFHD